MSLVFVEAGFCFILCNLLLECFLFRIFFFLLFLEQVSLSLETEFMVIQLTRYTSSDCV